MQCIPFKFVLMDYDIHRIHLCFVFHQMNREPQTDSFSEPSWCMVGLCDY